MAIIIAASLQLQTQAEDAVGKLILAGFAPEKVTSFFINPPGQHALYPIGGDRYQSPGMVAKPESAFVDIAEAVVGVMHDKKHSGFSDGASQSGNASTDGGVTSHASLAPPHRAGMLVAAEVADKTDQDKAITLLTQFGAHNIEKAEGEIVDGEWRDFDPLSEPAYI